MIKGPKEVPAASGGKIHYNNADDVQDVQWLQKIMM